jgi:Bacterial Ig-like domain (group 2)
MVKGRPRHRRQYDGTPTVGAVEFANYNDISILLVGQTAQLPPVTVSSIPWPQVGTPYLVVQDITGLYPVTYESSNPSIATVDSTGLATGVGSGSCTMVAIAEGVRSLALDVTVGTTPGNVFFEEDWSTGDFSRNQNGTYWFSRAGGSGDLQPAVTTINPYPGKTYSCQFQFGGNASLSDDAWSELTTRLGQARTEIYARYYLYLPDGTEGFGSAGFAHRYPGDLSTNDKWLEFWDEDYANYNIAALLQTRTSTSLAPDGNLDAVFGWKQSNGAVSGVGGHQLITQYPVVTYPALYGRWSKWQYHCKVGTFQNTPIGGAGVAGDGVMELEIDDVLVFSQSNLPIYSPYPGANNYFRMGRILGYSNSGYTLTTRVWLGPVKFSTGHIED